jgi:hypothetical protein
MAETKDEMKLTDARGLLEQLWAERGRPSLRWLRQQQKNNAIPHVRIAGRVFFDPAQVREALGTRRDAADGE